MITISLCLFSWKKCTLKNMMITRNKWNQQNWRRVKNNILYFILFHFVIENIQKGAILCNYAQYNYSIV